MRRLDIAAVAAVRRLLNRSRRDASVPNGRCLGGVSPSVECPMFDSRHVVDRPALHIRPVGSGARCSRHSAPGVDPGASNALHWSPAGHWPVSPLAALMSGLANRRSAGTWHRSCVPRGVRPVPGTPALGPFRCE